MKNTPYLQINGLSCERNEHLLFSKLYFSLSPGEILQVVGSNGSGKSTLLRLVAGVSFVAEGSIQRDPLSHHIYLGHQNAIKPTLSVRENIESMQIWSKDFKILDITRVLNKLDLKEWGKPAGNLSAGQQRRLALARLLLDPAEVWILDEPYTALDVEGSAFVDEMVLDQLKKGGAVLLSSHQPIALPGIEIRKIVLGGHHAC